MIFSEKLVVLRKRSGLSQEELAEKLGVTRQAVHKWETEKSMPNIEIIKTLSKLFDVSLDNLLNDKEDIYSKSASDSSKGKKIELGKVYVSEESISSVDIEGDNTKKTDLEIQQQKEKDKRVRLTFRLGIAIFIASLVICAYFMSNGSIASSTESFDFDKKASWQDYIVALTLLSGVVLLGISGWTKIFMHRHLKGSNEHFQQLVASEEQALEDAGYVHTRLQFDLRAWFFYHPERNCFGFYFNGKEQFTCPIQNYINFNYVIYGDGLVREDKINPTFVVGDIVGVGVRSTQTYSSNAGSVISFTMTYFDENGVDKQYSYSLISDRRYLYDKFDKKLAIIMILQSIPKATIENYEKIKTKLELEKNKLI